MFGFFILAVTGAILAALGWRFWRLRPDITWLSVGAMQTVFGILVALAPSRAAGGV